MGKMIELTASDGHKFAAYRAEPAGKPRGAIVVIQEIFGVNSHIKQVADGYAADGYLAIAPALFDRVQRNVELGYTPEDIAKGREIRGKVDERHGDAGHRSGDPRRLERRKGRASSATAGAASSPGSPPTSCRACRPLRRITAAASSTTPISRRRCR